MSLRAIVWAFAQHCPTANAKLVLIKLADNANDDGECWPSHRRVAEDTGLSRRTVIRYVKLLAEAGLIRLEHRVNGVGNLPNRYVLRCEETSSPLVTRCHYPGDSMSPPLVTACHPLGDTVSPKPSIEPKKEEKTDAIASVQKTQISGAASDARRGTRLSPDWGPSADDIAFAVALGLDPGRTAAEFRDYWCARPGAGATKLDWAATWRNRCRTIADRRGGRAGTLPWPSDDRGGSGGGFAGGNRQPPSKLLAAIGRIRLAAPDAGMD